MREQKNSVSISEKPLSSRSPADDNKEIRMSRKLCVPTLPTSTGGAMRGLATMNTASARSPEAQEELRRQMSLSPEERGEEIRAHLQKTRFFKKPRSS